MRIICKTDRFALFAITLLVSAPALPDEADVVSVDAICHNGSTCDFNVTVRHADEGWDHYADRWEVRTLDGKRLAIRELAHPHVNEQPFTRSLMSVRIPDSVTEVIVRARDSVHGYGGKEVTVQLRTHGSEPITSGTLDHPADAEDDG